LGSCALLCGSHESLVAVIIFLVNPAAGWKQDGHNGPEFLRQHYLDQVRGSPTFRVELSAFVVPWEQPVGSPS
jgi:hypothetical protein